MTSYEAEATSNLESDRDRKSGWYVLFLGLAVVGLTSGRDDAPSSNQPAAAESLRR